MARAFPMDCSHSHSYRLLNGQFGCENTEAVGLAPNANLAHSAINSEWPC